MFYNIKNFVLDLIFPKFCLGCQKEGTWVCPKCAQEILLVKSQVCPDCGRISKFGKYCLKHQKPHGLTGVLVAAYYEEGPLKELIHNFKYNHILEVGDFLGELLVEALSNNLTTGQDMIITAVPLNFWRQSQRGYNQSEVLAKYVANRLNENQPETGQPWVENFKILQKIRKTKPQVLTDSKKRRKNLINAFKISENINLFKKTIILVDDVTTTGATLNECAKVLRKAGARRVWGLVIAKG